MARPRIEKLSENQPLWSSIAVAPAGTSGVVTSSCAKSGATS
ncbi:Uncharacterised protein [Mycobacteroides abscessus]|nr:Uncharacterised protein [Mycobacteroides abscessus]